MFQCQGKHVDSHNRAGQNTQNEIQAVKQHIHSMGNNGGLRDHMYTDNVQKDGQDGNPKTHLIDFPPAVGYQPPFVIV